MRHVSEMSTINEMIKKYINLNDLYYLNSGNLRPEPVRFIQMEKDDTGMIFQFPCPVDTEDIKIYSIVSDRYVEFDMKNMTADDQSLGINTYRLKLKTCYLALDKRANPRIPLEKGICTIDNVSISKFGETPRELSNALFVKILAKEFTDRLEDYDTKIIKLINEEPLPEIALIKKSGIDILLNDPSEITTFIQKQSTFINDNFGKSFANELELSLIALLKQTNATLITPIQYHATDGSTFVLGHLILGRNSGSISPDDIEKLKDKIKSLSEKIRNGNYTSYKCRGDILDLSANGCKINLNDSSVIQTLVQKNGFLFNLMFDWGEPIRANGNTVYIVKSTDPGCNIGVSITGSQFGPEFEKKINARLKKLNKA